MKTLLIIILFFFGQSLCAQKNAYKKYAITIEGFAPISFGDNFLNKAYGKNLGFGLSLQRNFRKFFVEYGYQRTELRISNTKLVGNFVGSELESSTIFVGIRHQLPNPKNMLEYRVGFGELILKNDALFAVNNNNANLYTIGARFNRKIKNGIQFYGALDIRHASFSVNDVSVYTDFYQNTYQLVPAIGVKGLW